MIAPPADPLLAIASSYGLHYLTVRQAQDHGADTLSRLLAVAARRWVAKAA